MPFKNPILAGTELIREAIESPNYVAGVSGWSINRDGTADFNDVTTRGTLIVGGPEYDDPSTIAITTEFSGDPVAFFTDSGGRTYTIQAFASGDPNGKYLAITPDATAGDSSTFVVFNEGGIGFSSSFIGGSRIVLFDDDTAYMRVADGFSGANIVPEGWTNLGLSNGWTNFGGGYSDMRCMRSADGFVHLEGTIAPGVTANGTLITTLPVGFRPLTTVRRVPWTNVGKNGCADIATNGQVTIFDAAGIAAASFCVQFPIVV